MVSVLKYGLASTLTLDLPAETVVADCTQAPGQPLADPSAAVAAALCDPLEFPPLVQATVPGDRIVLALADDVPQVAAVVAGVVQTLLAGSTEAENITILRTQADAQFAHRDPTALLSPEVAAAIGVVTHDATQREQMSYLAASEDAQPIYIQRLLGDADLVIPIGCLRVEDSLGWLGVYGGLYPTFSDEETQRRFWATASSDSRDQWRKRQHEAREAAWLLGVPFTLQIVPGAEGTVLHVLAGDIEAVVRRGRELCDSVWNRAVPRRASLVVATVDGDEDQQTWDNFARALFAASRAVQDQGSIAICMDLNTRPGPALRRLAAADNPEDALRALRKERGPDAIPAVQLVQALSRQRVYLLSRLDVEVVEELGVAPIASPDEVVRLSSRHPSCILLANANFALPVPPDERK